MGFFTKPIDELIFVQDGENHQPDDDFIPTKSVDDMIMLTI
jgi:hypothetical protein